MRKLITITLFSLIILSCKKNCDDKANIKSINVDLKINRLDQQLFNNKTIENVNNFTKTNPFIAKVFFQNSNINTSNDSLLNNHILKLISDPSLNEVYDNAQAVFNNDQDFKSSLEEAFKHVKYYYPDFNVPNIGMMVSGFNRDILISDSSIVYGIDYFLGEKCKYTPDLPIYILKRMKKEYMAPMTILAISNKYNKTDLLDQSLLASMIWYGKALYFTKQMMPCVHDSLIIGYSGKQLLDTETHESIVWGHFIQKNLLYETSHTVDKYVSERPYTAEIGSKCPGRIGQWLGWRIVDKYMKENPKVTLQALMQDTDVKNIFTRSKYKPRI